jgi:uncharacterized membrane protein
MADKPIRDELAVLEPWIGRLLRAGVFVSAFVIFAGIVASWILPGSQGFTPNDITKLRSGQELAFPVVPPTLAAVHTGLVNFDATTIVALGLVALIALPILRVALTSVLFFYQRDFLYFFFTVIVLGTLAVGILL